MISFQEFLIERYLNLFKKEEKAKYAEQVYTMLQNAYKKIGGVKGNGFNSPEDMIKNIPFWKIVKKNNKIVCGSLYKDKNGRKYVASFTDGTEQGKEELLILIMNELGISKNKKVFKKEGRSYFEISGPLLNFLQSNMDKDILHSFAVNIDAVKNILEDPIKKIENDDPEVIKHPELANYFYQRKLGNHWHTKIMFGTPYKTIL